jgi:hypothetical protein
MKRKTKILNLPPRLITPFYPSSRKLNNQTRDYFLRLRFYSELDMTTEPIKDLEVLILEGEIGVT